MIVGDLAGERLKRTGRRERADGGAVLLITVRWRLGDYLFNQLACLLAACDMLFGALLQMCYFALLLPNGGGTGQGAADVTLQVTAE